jgi:PAS domain S-box-containing protein
MSLKKLFRILLGIQVALGVVLAVLAGALFLNQKELSRSQRVHFQSYLLADELRQSSDDLTRLARTYVATGNEEFERQYWAVLDIRNGKRPRPVEYNRIYWDFITAAGQKPRPDGKSIFLRDLMIKEGFTAAELEKLSQAKSNSDGLVQTERIAMNAVKGLFDDGAGNFTVKKAPDRDLASLLMNDEAYHQYKAGIMGPIDEFYVMLAKRTAEDVARHEQRSTHLLEALGAVIIAIMGMFGYSFVSLRRQIAEREQAEEKLREQGIHLKAILEAAADGILAVDTKGKVLRASRRFYEIWRMPESIMESGDDKALLDCALTQLSDPEAFLMKVRQLYYSDAESFDTFTFKDGRVIERYSFAMIMGGERIGRVWSFRDVSERKKLEALLANERALLRTLVDHLPAAIYLKDSAGRKTMANPLDLRNFGLADESAVIGRTDFDFFPPEQASAFHADDKQVLETGQPVLNREEILTRPDGTTVWNLTSKVPLTDSAGRVVGLAGSSLDITEIRKAREALRELNQHVEEAKGRAEHFASEAEAANRAKSEFLAMMTHELRNPLSGVLGFAQLLSDTALNDEQKGYVRRISSSGEHLLAVVNDTLDLSSIEAGALAIHAAPFDLAHLLKLSSDIVRKSAADKGLAFHCDVAADVPAQIAGDERRIRQILINLLSNAVKFTASGSVVLRVARSGQPESLRSGRRNEGPVVESVTGFPACEPDQTQDGKPVTHFPASRDRDDPVEPTVSGEFLEFSVKDTGLGISSEALARLFQLFTQADSTIHQKYGGTGIGLAVSQCLAEAMGGTISVASTPGKGSTFTFRFPLEVPAGGMAPSHLFTGTDGASPSSPCAETPVRPDRLPVLIVEDDRSNSFVVGKMLQNLGYRVEFAANGDEAVEAFAPGKYLAILMDLRMPVMDGFEAVAIIRSRESGSRVPIIALSANVLPGSREIYLAAGMDDFLPKPFKKEELAAILASVAQR